MQNRHFEKLFALMKQPFYEGMSFNLELMLKGGIMNYKDNVGDISGTASGEAQLEASLEKIRAGWENMAFVVLNHRDQVTYPPS